MTIMATHSRHTTHLWTMTALKVGLAFLLCAHSVQAEFRDIDIIMPPTDAYVHFTDGYLIAPGYVDLSALRFTALSEAAGDTVDDTLFGTDDAQIPDEDDVGDDMTQPPRLLEGGKEVGATTIDVAVFPLPASCANTRSGCDWTDLGIGGKLEDGTTRWCCSNDAIDFKLCEGGDDYGRLIINDDKFVGDLRFVEIAPSGAVTKALRSGKMEEHGTLFVVSLWVIS